MDAEHFLNLRTLYILVLGAVAFSFSTAGGIIFAKIINIFLSEKNKINPCIGAAGVSAVPMAAAIATMTAMLGAGVFGFVSATTPKGGRARDAVQRQLRAWTNRIKRIRKEWPKGRTE